MQEKLTVPLDFPHFLNLMRAHLRLEPFDRPLRDALHILYKECLPHTNATATHVLKEHIHLCRPCHGCSKPTPDPQLVIDQLDYAASIPPGLSASS
jgi:hypothetical protein